MRAKALEKVGETKKKEWQLVVMVVETLRKKKKEPEDLEQRP